jgi:hypothetical protein
MQQQWLYTLMLIDAVLIVHEYKIIIAGKKCALSMDMAFLARENYFRDNR